MKYKVQFEGEWLDEILFRFYGNIEGTLDIAFSLNQRILFQGKNTSLSAIGYRLPRGLEIDLPEPPVQKKSRYVSLFD